MEKLENFTAKPRGKSELLRIARTIQLDQNGALKPKIVLRGREALKLKAIRLDRKNSR